jgi:hypothetical protein
LEAALERAVANLIKAGTIASMTRVVDS